MPRWAMALVAVLALGAGLAFQLTRPPPPAALAHDLDGRELTLQSGDGAPLVINFWATWCPPCVRELPMIEAAAAERASAPGAPRVVAVAIDSADKVAAFVAEHGLSLPVAIATDAGQRQMQQWGNERALLPFSVRLDAEGALADQVLGELDEDSLARLLR